MISDNATFFLAFAAVFLLLGGFLWKLHLDAKRLEFRLQVLEETRPEGARDATAKNQDE